MAFVLCKVCRGKIEHRFMSQIKRRKYCSRKCLFVDSPHMNGRRVEYPMEDFRLHKIWSSAIRRCRNPEAKNYAGYGGRGITFCDEWNDFWTFFYWAMMNGYREDLSIERIDNDLGYCPENCRFATKKEQARNRRSSRFITAWGATKTIAEWAESSKSNVNYNAIRDRINDGVPPEIAMTKPLDPAKGRFVKGHPYLRH